MELFFICLDYDMHKGTNTQMSLEKVSDICVFTWVAQDLIHLLHLSRT